MVSLDPHVIFHEIHTDSSCSGPSTTKSKDIGGMGMGDVHKNFGKNILVPWCASGTLLYWVSTLLHRGYVLKYVVKYIVIPCYL